MAKALREGITWASTEGRLYSFIRIKVIPYSIHFSIYVIFSCRLDIMHEISYMDTMCSQI